MILSVVKAILLCVYASVCFGSSAGRIILPKNDFVSAVLAFGDSFADQGNNNYVATIAKANYPPYGIDFPGGEATGRFSNGRTIPDFIAEALGVKDYLPPSLDPSLNDEDIQTGVSFASGGSGYDPLTTTITTAIPLSEQVDMFEQYIMRLKRNIEEEAVNNIITNSVVVVVASTNDLLVSYPIRKLEYDDLAYSNMLVEQVLNFLKEIYTLGIRRILLFSAPPVGCLPAARTLYGGLERSCADKENNVSKLFSNILKQQLQLWTTSFPESSVAFIDYYNSLLSIIENPSKYGFDVADRGCCGTGLLEMIYLCNIQTPICPNRSEYLFWDSFHLTEKGNSVIANYALQDLVNSI